MKNTVYDTLTTPWAEGMDRVTPWSEYPRPSMVRDSYLSLCGEWDFAVTEGDAPTGYNERILVPFPPESMLSGIERAMPKDGTLYYLRTVTLPDGFKSGRLLLHFGAVDNFTVVRINGISVGEHIGGYLPFTLDITEAVGDADSFELTVEVRDPLDKRYPYGKQTDKRGGMWYTPVSGIWQAVWLESVPEKYIEKMKITPSMIGVRIEFTGGDEAKRITVENDGKTYECRGACCEIRPDEPHLWTPDDPYIYRFTVECGEDKISSYFALREITTGTVEGVPRILLNGKPYLFTGLLDQGYYPDGLFLPATADGYRDDILTAKKCGFNMLRKHIKIEPEIFYYLCDTLGMAVFQDMVNNSSYSFLIDTALPTVGIKRLSDKYRHSDPVSREIFKKHSLETLEHLYNFPSIVYYTVFNEGWGQFTADECYRLVKSADPTRVIDATSGWFTQKESDVDSRHVYFKKVKLGRVTDRPIVISEFGGYSHRAEGHLFGSANYGYKLFDDEEGFRNAFMRLYTEEIEPILPCGVSALVYTQVSDVEDETNGILTYDRRHLKLDADAVREMMIRHRKAVEEVK